MNIKTFGLEKEFFIKKNDEFALAPFGLPKDDCGWLAEARSEPHADPMTVKHLLNAAVERLASCAHNLGVALLDAHEAKLTNEFMRLARRQFGKGPSRSYFAHGGAYKADRPRAGLHIHFGNKREIRDEDGDIIETVQESMNIPRIIWFLDNAFKDEIKASKRVFGEYEMKDWGFEYRSLPSSIDLNKVVDVLEALKKE